MKTLKTFIALAVLLPLAAWAGTFGEKVAVDPTELVPVAGAELERGADANYDCCWIWWMGTWWCIPC
jgi:hypothetical protein